MKPKPKKKFTAKELKLVGGRALSEFLQAPPGVMILNDCEILIVNAITRYINRKLK